MTAPSAQEYPPYEGFPDGVSDAFCQHAAVATSQYGTTARALAAEVIRLRAHAATLHAALEERETDITALRADRTAAYRQVDARDLRLLQAQREVTTLREALKELQQRQQKQDRVFRVGLAALEFIAGQLSQEDLEQVVLHEHAERQGIQ